MISYTFEVLLTLTVETKGYLNLFFQILFRKINHV